MRQKNKKDVVIIQRAKSLDAGPGQLAAWLQSCAPDLQDWKNLAPQANWTMSHDKSKHELHAGVVPGQGCRFMSLALANAFTLERTEDIGNHTEFVFTRDASDIDFTINSLDGLKISYKSG